MDFVQKTNWHDEPATDTPITAAELLRLEAGVAEGARSATESQTGNVQLASPADMTAGSDLTLVPAVKRVADYVTARLAAISNPAASETVPGIVELATAAEVTTGTDLTRAVSVKRIVDYINTRIAALPAATAATETAAGIVELATAAEMTTGTDLTRAPAVKRVADYVTTAINTLSASVTASLSGKADKTGSWNQFADVADTAYTDGDAPVFSAGLLQPTDLSANFAGLDAALRLDPANFPQWYTPVVIINEGDVPPSNFPAYGLVGKLPAAPTLLPTLLDSDSVRAANNVVMQLAEAVNVGDYIGFTVGWSNEANFDHISAAFGGTGAGAGIFDFGTISAPNTTAGELNGFVKVTTAAAAGSTITFTVRDATNAAINRVHLMAAIYRLPNLVASAPRDQQAVAGGSSSATLTSIGASITTDTVQPNEIAIGSVCFTVGTSPNLRDISGTSDWSTLANVLSDNGSSGRRLYVGYKVLSAIGRPSLTTVVTLSGTATQTGIWSAKLDTYKGT